MASTLAVWAIGSALLSHFGVISASDGTPNITFNSSDCAEANCSQHFPVPDMGPPLYVYIYVTSISLTVFIVGITGNVLVIQAVARTRAMHKRMNYFLVSLSVADLLLLAVGLPMALQELYGKDRWYIGEAMCKIFPFLENMSHHCSVLTLLAIGFERYYAICHPLQTVGQRLTSTSVVIPVVWIISCAVSLPFLILTEVKVEEFYDGSFHDTCKISMQLRFSRIYITVAFTMFLVVPLLLLTAMYSSIILTLSVGNVGVRALSSGHSKSHQGLGVTVSARSSLASVNMVGASRSGSVGALNGNGQVAASGSGGRGHDTDMVRHARVVSSRRQVVRMMVAVMILYFCCLMPFRCVQIWTVYSSDSDKERLGLEGYLNLLYCMRILIYLNSAGNPIIYGLLSSNFRAAFKHSFLGCHSGRKKNGLGYNTAYYTNSQHQYYLQQQQLQQQQQHQQHAILSSQNHGSPRVARLTVATFNSLTSSNRSHSGRSLESNHSLRPPPSVPLNTLRKGERSCESHVIATVREPLLTPGKTADENQNGNEPAFL